MSAIVFYVLFDLATVKVICKLTRYVAMLHTVLFQYFQYIKILGLRAI